MKRNILSLSALLVAVAIIFSSCGKEDVGAPKVSITGDNPFEIELGATFTDPGATANDEEDGDLTSKINVTPLTISTDKVDEITVTYKVTDKAGNDGSATRKVRVKANKLTGLYRVTDTYSDGETFQYDQQVNTNVQGYNMLTFSQYGTYGQNALLIVTAGPTGFTASNLNFVDSDNDNISMTNISGTYEKVGQLYNVKTMKYTISINNGTPTHINQAYSRLS
jgi:hypothetical protein